MSKKEKVEGAVDNSLRRGLQVDLSDLTLASIEAASTKFGGFGLTKTKARQLVAARISELAANVSAIDLFAAEVEASLEALKK